MATGVGDLVATLSLDNSQFSSGMRESASIAGEKGEEIEMHVGGASRAFKFLGKEAHEAGEAMGGEFGEAIEGIGGMTSGLGEAVHGYHALHTAIEVATGAQAILNSISPLGWAALAAGAIAATAAYLHFTESTKDATDDLDDQIKELNDELEETAKIEDALAKKQFELGTLGMTEGQKYAATFAYDHPDATASEVDRAKQLGFDEDLKKAQARMTKEADEEHLAEVKRLHAEIDSLTKGPMDRLIEQAHDLKAGLDKGTLRPDEYQSAMSALQRKAETEQQKEQKQASPELAKALEYGTAAAWEKITQQMYNPEQKQVDESIAENTARTAELLQYIKDNTGGGFSLP